MLHKFRLLLTTASTAILLLACTSETTEDASNEISSTDTAEVQTTETLDDENDSEDEATPLVGLYRYNPETKEVLVSDYLTGEFIPYENLD